MLVLLLTGRLVQGVAPGSLQGRLAKSAHVVVRQFQYRLIEIWIRRSFCANEKDNTVSIQPKRIPLRALRCCKKPGKPSRPGFSRDDEIGRASQRKSVEQRVA